MIWKIIHLLAGTFKQKQHEGYKIYLLCNQKTMLRIEVGWELKIEIEMRHKKTQHASSINEYVGSDANKCRQQRVHYYLRRIR